MDYLFRLESCTFLIAYAYEQEEEIRKKMEELAIQRQKRIAERTAASGGFSAATKKASESKQVKGSNPRTVRRQTM